ncbi:MAG TPA: hypothetical protein VGQ37_26595 [Vicinamibacterales bacterium]|nr:hypothetical protein [Vicinamibacterales bacterium]
MDPRLRVEVSFEAPTTLLGLNGLNVGTYMSSTRSDQTLEGEGRGVFASPDGEMATWKGVGNGRYLPDGAVSYRGGLAFTSSTPKLSRLNAVAGVFEFEVAADGTTRSRIWEWK